jgi:poly(3-hydroxybutyrate) depolymerase
MHTIQTMGTKAAGCADTKCGAWMYTRQYFLTLPAGYDKNKAYPLIIETPTCVGLTGADVYTLNSSGNDTMAAHNLADNTVIRVGLTPPPVAVGTVNYPSDCFDSGEGDDSVDFVFYENLYDKLAGQLCFDRNRVFAAGVRRGGPVLTELGCKYAGDATRPVRGVLSDEGGLAFSDASLPTCTDKPTAGMWIHNTGDGSMPFTRAKVAIARAMKADGCTIGTGFDDAQFDDFPIGGGNPATTCKKIKGCPDVSPLVVCPFLSNQSSVHPTVANPGFSTFLKLFETAPLLTQ